MGGGKAEGQLCLRPVGTLMVRERMRKAPEVQSGRALPMGRCASPPCTGIWDLGHGRSGVRMVTGIVYSLIANQR